VTLVLYDNPVSGNCHKVRLILALLGIEYERRELSVVDYSDRLETLGGLSPTLNVPTVMLEDGRPLAESNAILWYFADGTEYLPADAYERAQVLQWMFFEQYKHEPGVAVVRFWDSIAPTGLTPPPGLEARREDGRVALKAMERHLREREYFVGGSLTIADIALFAYTHVAHEAGHDLKPLPVVRAWLERVEAQPGIVPMDPLGGRGAGG
jgi:glutathione S-transferase